MTKVCCIVSSDMTIRYMLFDQLKCLQKNGYDVYVVCSPGKLLVGIEKENIKVKTIEIKRKVFSPLSDIKFFLKLYFYLKKEKFDIVHTHTFKPDFYGQIAARLAKVPIIIRTSHGFCFGEKASFIEKKFHIFFEKIMTKNSDLFFSIAFHIIDQAIKEKIISSEKAVYLGRDINTQRFNPQNFSAEFVLKKKKELHIPLNKKIIGIVARLVEEKGYPELFSAFKKVINDFPETILLVVGPNEPEKKDAVNPKIVKYFGIENNVLFLGERLDIDQIYPVIDIFVLPTRIEGLGASILEASSFEKPVIATNTGGCPEAIDDDKTGILVPINCPEKLAEAMIFLIKNPDIAIKMGEAGRKKVIKEFNSEVVFRRLLAGYDKIIASKWLKKEFQK